MNSKMDEQIKSAGDRGFESTIENGRLPESSNREFASRVRLSSEDDPDDMPASSKMTASSQSSKRSKLTVDNYVEGVLSGNRTILARTITLVESNSKTQSILAQQVIKRLLPHSGKSIRIGITGIPGVGKSTFIETLGCYLCRKGHRLAVLAVDPSSSISKGSILGDKTRMEKLSKQPNCFIRPSPSGGALGGLTRKSRETILVCEAAGFDIILVETVGVGQSEVAVRSMVDFFLLLMLSGVGDELQGIKRGVIEFADALLINKADGDNKPGAEAAKAEYNRTLDFLQSATEGWTTRAYTCSSISAEGIPEIWSVIEEFQQKTTASGIFAKRRRRQLIAWVRAMVEQYLHNRFFKNESISKMLPGIEQAVEEGTMSAAAAVQELIRVFESVSK